MINDSFRFSSWIVILFSEYFTDLIVPSWLLSIWVRNIRIRIPRSERMKKIFAGFILFEIQLCLCLLIYVPDRLLVLQIWKRAPKLLLF